METTDTIEGVRAVVRKAAGQGLSIGFVPTMGALHEGHASLIRACKRSAGFTVVSIFVNPLQFGPHEDYQRYPRTWDHDRELCVAAGADAIFAPDVAEIYPPVPPGLTSLRTFVDVPGLSERLEGARRPGHFRGVATVVLKLFEIVRPDEAWFGRKDYQQGLVISQMVRDLNLPVTIQIAETVREPDGLALSSRNRYLNPEERRAAAILSQALRNAAQAVREGLRDADRVRQILKDTVESEPLADLDYAEAADAQTLEPLRVLDETRPAVALLAVRIGPARLIDNLPLL